MPFDALADEFVRTDEDIYLTGFEVLENGLYLFGRFETTEELNTHRHILHALGESVIVLQRQNGCRHEHRHLFAVCRHFECRTHRHFRLTETDISAHQAVHRHRTLEVVLHVRRRFRLVRRVFVEERGLQLMLHVPVGRISVTFLLLAGGVQTDEVTRYIFHLVLRPFLEPFPCARAQTRYRRFAAFTPFVLADTMQVMNRDEHVRPVAVDEFDHLLRLAVHGRCDQSAELGNTVVAMYHVIAYLQLVYLTQSDDGFSAPCVLAGHRHAVVTLENLMVSIAANLQLMVHKSFMQRRVDSLESERLFVLRLEDSLQAIELFLLLGQYIDFVSVLNMFLQVIREDVELLMEQRLRHRVERNLRMRAEGALLVEFNSRPLIH